LNLFTYFGNFFSSSFLPASFQIKTRIRFYVFVHSSEVIALLAFVIVVIVFNLGSSSGSSFGGGGCGGGGCDLWRMGNVVLDDGTGATNSGSNVGTDVGAIHVTLSRSYAGVKVWCLFGESLS